MTDSIRILSGNGNWPLAWEILKNVNGPGADERKLRERFLESIPGRFLDGEIKVRVGEHVRGERVYILQSLCRSLGADGKERTVNDNLAELLLMVDACRRASCEGVTCVIPYFGYCRQDKKVEGRVPISARAVADVLSAVRADRIVTVDLHAAQIQGFFTIPVDNLYAFLVLAPYVKKKLGLAGPNVAVVSPDVGGVRRAQAYADALGAAQRFLIKERIDEKTVTIKELIGDVRGCRVLIVDDIVSTAGTLREAAEFLKKRGAAEVVACATHAILCGNALENLGGAPIDRTIVTDTVPLDGREKTIPRLEVVSIARMLADVIRVIHNHGSVSRYIEEKNREI